jgi:hypothetical protein
MADNKSAQIVSQKGGPEERSVELTLHHDGSIEMHTYDVSQLASRVWGREDYEFWTMIAPSAVSLLAFELVRSRFAGRDCATDELGELCKTYNIPHKWDHYP